MPSTTTLLDATLPAGTEQVISVPADEVSAPEPADQAYLRMNVSGWGAGKGTVRILDPEIAPPTAPTFTYLGGGDTPGLSTTAMLDVGRSVNDDLLVKVAGKGNVTVKIELYGVIDEDQALRNIEENTDFTDEEFTRFMADSPAIFDPTPSDLVPGCTSSAEGEVELELCLEGGTTPVAPGVAQAPQSSAAEEVCDDPFAGLDDGWVLDDRFNACRNTPYKLAVKTGGILSPVRIVLEQKVTLLPRSPTFLVKSRFHFREADSGDWMNSVTFDVSANCSGDLECLNNIDGRFDLYDGTSSDYLSSTIQAKLFRLNQEEFVRKDYQFTFALSTFYNGSRSDFVRSRVHRPPITRCDSADYFKVRAKGANRSRDTSGCVLSAYNPIFSEVRFTEDERFKGVQESAEHIYDAQRDNIPGAPGGTSLTRIRNDEGDVTANRNLARERCREKEPNRPSYSDCDEYAFATTEQGCAFGKCSAKYIDRSDNRRAGGLLAGWQKANRLLADDAFCVNVTTPPESLQATCDDK